MRALPVCLAATLLAACASISPPPPPLAADTALPVAAAPRKGQAGGVFVSNYSSWSLTSDSRAFRPGDILTVVLQETTQASKKADTQFGKNSSAAIQPLGLGGKLIRTDVGLDAKRDFAGTATSTQENALQGAITVVVQEVMPNGLLHILGDKSLYLNQGEEMIRVSGYVRIADIDTDNQVSSQRIANARISYAGQGALADANNAGWLSRFFVSPWMPF